MNSQHVTLLLLLDLSAAFDTVNHEILVRRLNTNFGVRRKVLLPRRSQRISLSELCHIWKVWLTFWRSNGLLYGALTVCRLCFRAVWYNRVTFTWSSPICWYWHSIILIIKTWWCQCARRGRCSYGVLPLLVIRSSTPKQLSRIISKFKHCTGWGLHCTQNFTGSYKYCIIAPKTLIEDCKLLVSRTASVQRHVAFIVTINAVVNTGT